jgi:hypothetical protein
MKLLFAQNKISTGRSKPVVCTNTVTGEYAGLNECVRAIDPSAKGGAFTRQKCWAVQRYLPITIPSRYQQITV